MIWLYAGFIGFLLLMLVGIKMLVAERLEEMIRRHFNVYLLALVFLIVAAGVAASLIADHRDHQGERRRDR